MCRQRPSRETSLGLPPCSEEAAALPGRNSQRKPAKTEGLENQGLMMEHQKRAVFQKLIYHTKNQEEHKPNEDDNQHTLCWLLLCVDLTGTWGTQIFSQMLFWVPP